MAKIYKSAGLTAAIIAGESAAMDKAAAKVAQAVKREAAKHRDTGDFQRSIKTKRVRGRSGVTDREVYTDDPNAWTIETGHLAPDGTHVPGNFTFINTARRLGKKRSK